MDQSKKYPNQVLNFLLTISFLGLLVLITLDQANPLFTKLERDSGIFLYTATAFFKKSLPYVFSWDNKPPGIFFINMIALFIGKETRWGIWVTEFVFLFLSTSLGFIFLKRELGKLPAVIGTLTWIIGINRVLAGGNFTEEYSLLFNFAALFFWSRSLQTKKTWFDICIGLCMGCAALLRPNNIGVPLSIIAVAAAQKITTKSYKEILIWSSRIILAFFIPFLLSGIFFAKHGAYNEFISGALLYNLSYGGHLSIRSSVLGGFASLGFAGGIASIGYFLSLLQDTSQLSSPLKTVRAWILINGPIEIILSGLSGKAYEHYFICWLPFVAVSTAYLISTLITAHNIKLKINSNYFVIIPSLALILLFPGVFRNYKDTAARILYQREKGIQSTDRIAEYVNATTNSNDKVLIWGGQTGINFLSKRDAPTRYIFYPLFEESPFTEEFGREYLQAIQENPPTLIVDGSAFDPEKIISIDETSPKAWHIEHNRFLNPYLIEILTVIRQNYFLETTINNIPIYRFK